ncbi:MAG: TonB family protein [Pyrinomonadaceae bacterium]
MGKIVKYCGSCDEGFAEKFGFCPNCGASLEAFEMNPLAVEAAPVEPPTPKIIAAPVAAVSEPVIEEPKVSEPAAVKTASKPEVAEEIAVPVIKPAAPKWIAPAAPVFTQTKPVYADRIPASFEAEHDKYVSEGGFYVTVIEEKNAKQRNVLLLGSTVLIATLAMSATVYSLFNKSLGVYAIGDDTSLASLIDEVPMTVEEEKLQKKDKAGGGGGGGGREEKEEVTQGDLADQAKNPTRLPDAKVFRSDNTELKLQTPTTEGDQKFEKKFDRWGDPNGRFASFSNGTGSGGGQGSGVGTGQGSGRGTGAGSGTGSGYGGGLGNGNGDGTGPGGGSDGPPPPVVPRGVTQGIKILSKPRPGYTDAARQNNIQGTVILRVTFLGSGQIGSISPVKGLGNGLTEQAIAAARRISFEPAKTNGVGQTVTKQIEYTFSIY